MDAVFKREQGIHFANPAAWYGCIFLCQSIGCFSFLVFSHNCLLYGWALPRFFIFFYGNEHINGRFIAESVSLFLKSCNG